MEKKRREIYEQDDYEFEETAKKNRYNHPSAFEVQTEKNYFNKLKNQRQKIENLYRDYANAQKRLEEQEIDIEKYKKNIELLTEKTKDNAKHKQLLMEHEALKAENQRIMKQNHDAKAKLEQQALQKRKSMKQLKQYFLTEFQALERDNIELKEHNEQLEIQISRLQKIQSQTSKQNENIKQKYEKLKIELNAIQERYKCQFVNFQKILEERDHDIVRLKSKLSSTQKTNLQQTYFIQLEKQRNQQVEEEFKIIMDQLKGQIKQLQRELFCVNQSKEDNDRHQITDKIKQYELRILQLQQQLTLLKANNLQYQNKASLLIREEKRRLDEDKEELKKQLDSTRKELYVLQIKFEKLNQMYKRKDIKESIRKNLLQYQHLQIDKLNQLLKL